MAYTAEQLIQVLPAVEYRVFLIDRAAKVQLRYDDSRIEFYFHVTLRDPHGMPKLAAAHLVVQHPDNDAERFLVPIKVELVQEVVTHIKELDESTYRGTKWSDIHLTKAPLFEPIWVLRAQDQLAEATIQNWIELATSYGCDAAVLRRASQHLTKVREWPTKKLPD